MLAQKARCLTVERFVFLQSVISMTKRNLSKIKVRAGIVLRFPVPRAALQPVSNGLTDLLGMGYLMRAPFLCPRPSHTGFF